MWGAGGGMYICQCICGGRRDKEEAERRQLTFDKPLKGSKDIIFIT